MRRTILASIMVVLSAHPLYSAEAGQQDSTALSDLDSAFIAAHAAANELDLSTGGPIVLLRDGKLILIRDKTQTAVQVVLPDYEAFKTFAHIPVAIYLLLGPPGAGKLDAQRINQLEVYRAKLDIVENNIKQFGLNGRDIERQRKILAESKQFLEKVIEQQRCTTEELHTFTHSMLPMIKENIAGAAASQLDAIHRQVMAWRKELTPAEWKKLRVAIKGAVLARNGSLAKQYFERLLHVEGEGVRLNYMELYFPPTPMLTLLATRSVDRGIGNAVFDDPNRMFRDVLADAASVHLKNMQFE